MKDNLQRSWSGMLTIGLLLIVLGAFSCKNKAPGQNSTIQVAENPQRPVQNALPKAQNPAEAKQNALTFLSKSAWEFDFVFFYSFYQPRFAWPELAAQSKCQAVMDSLRAAGNTRQADEMQQFWRMLDPGFVLPAAAFDQAKDLDRIMLPSLYCDHYPIDTVSYFELLREESQKESYALPHILLASLWAEDKGCLQGQAWKDLRADALSQTRGLLGDRPIWTDLQIECAAILLLANESLPAHFISELVALQNPDGGWPDYAKGSHSDTHATVLALMVMELSK